MANFKWFVWFVTLSIREVFACKSRIEFVAPVNDDVLTEIVFSGVVSREEVFPTDYSDVWVSVNHADKTTTVSVYNTMVNSNFVVCSESDPNITFLRANSYEWSPNDMRIYKNGLVVLSHIENESRRTAFSNCDFSNTQQINQPK